MFEPGLVIREADGKYLDELADMTVRFYRFNEEFDPAYSTREDIASVAKDYIEESLNRDDVLILIALWNEEPAGFVRAEIRSHRLIKNGKYAALVELYVKPRYRRKGIASKLLAEAKRKLGERNIVHVAAQFPAMNMIAERFYKKHGFRPWTQIFIHEVE
jgi:ribosomal protein S18 acetylase RimI-like enzyme